MWLENAKQIPISYISVQLFPRKKKNKHTCLCPQKVRDKWGPMARDQGVKLVREHGGFFSYSFPSWWLQNVHCSQRKHTLFYATMWLSSTDITEEV